MRYRKARLALHIVLMAVILAGAACTKAAPPATTIPYDSAPHNDVYADSLTPSRALAIAPIAIVGIIESERPYIPATRLRLLNVRVVRVLFDVSAHPVQTNITLEGLPPSAMPLGATEMLSLYPITLRQLGIAYRPDCRFAASGGGLLL